MQIGFGARAAPSYCRALARYAPFWQDESCDGRIRREEQATLFFPTAKKPKR
jgi:hypothetical protein